MASKKESSKEDQVVMFIDIRNFLSTSAYIEEKFQKQNKHKIDKFYQLMEFYYKSICKMFLPLVKYIIEREIKKKKDIVSNIFTNPTGDGMLLVIGGKKPSCNTIAASYIFAIYLNVVLQAFAEKMKKEFQLKRLIPSSGIALAFGEVRKIQYKDPKTKYNLSTFLSNIINRAARIESLNKDHDDSEISIDSSFANELYKFFYPKEDMPQVIMHKFKDAKNKDDRLKLLENLHERDMELLLHYKGKHNFKGGAAIVHSVSKVLVTLCVSKNFKKLKISDELNVFCENACQKLSKTSKHDFKDDLVKPMKAKLLSLMRDLDKI